MKKAFSIMTFVLVIMLFNINVSAKKYTCDYKFGDENYVITKDRKSPAAGAKTVNNSNELKNLRKELSKAIGNKLLEPLKPLISKNKNWIISPDGDLNNIPFETLQFDGKMALELANIT